MSSHEHPEHVAVEPQKTAHPELRDEQPAANDSRGPKSTMCEMTESESATAQSEPDTVTNRASVNNQQKLARLKEYDNLIAAGRIHQAVYGVSWDECPKVVRKCAKCSNEITLCKHGKLSESQTPPAYEPLACNTCGKNS